MMFNSLCFPGGSVVNNPPANAGDVGLIPGLGRSPGRAYGNPLQYSCLGNPTDRGAWWATVQGGAKESDTTSWLNNNNSLYLAFDLMADHNDSLKPLAEFSGFFLILSLSTTVLSDPIILFLPLILFPWFQWWQNSLDNTVLSWT